MLKIIRILFLGVFFLGLPNSAIADWHIGGTLHKSNIGEWNSSSYSNKLATAGDFAATLAKNSGKIPRSMSELKNRAWLLMKCLNGFAGQGGFDNQKTASIAVLCGIQLGF